MDGHSTSKHDSSQGVFPPPSGTVADRVQPKDIFDQDEIPVEELLRPLTRYRRRIGVATLVGALVFLLTSFVIPERFSATASFVPEASGQTRLGSSLASLSGLAGQIGLGAGLLGGSQADYYASLLRSRELLEETLRTPFTGPDSVRGPRPLVDILDIRGKTVANRTAKGVRLLRRRASTHVDKRSGIVELTVSLPYPALAADVSNSLIRSLNRFNTERRQFQSREQRRFAGERKAVAERELRAAERSQLVFLQANRYIRGSPLLEYEASRLERAVTEKQQIYQSVSQAYEEARIAEVQDTPVLTSIDSAVAPDRRSFPNRTVFAFVGAVIGAVILIAVAYIAAWRERASQLA